jgi:hypothetical protein
MKNTTITSGRPKTTGPRDIVPTAPSARSPASADSRAPPPLPCHCQPPGPRSSARRTTRPPPFLFSVAPCETAPFSLSPSLHQPKGATERPATYFLLLRKSAPRFTSNHTTQRPSSPLYLLSKPVTRAPSDSREIKAAAAIFSPPR